MLLKDYIAGNPFSGPIMFSVRDTKRNRPKEGFCGTADLSDKRFRRYCEHEVLKAEIAENGWLTLEVFEGNDEEEPLVPPVEMQPRRKDVGWVIAKKECLLADVDEVLNELCDAYTPPSYELAIDDAEDEMLVVDGFRIVVPALHISLRQGDVCEYDPDSQLYTAAFSVSILYEADETDPQKYLHWEQGSFQVTLYNYFRKNDHSMEDLGTMICIVEIEQE